MHTNNPGMPAYDPDVESFDARIARETTETVARIDDAYARLESIAVALSTADKRVWTAVRTECDPDAHPAYTRGRYARLALTDGTDTIEASCGYEYRSARPEFYLLESGGHTQPSISFHGLPDRPQARIAWAKHADVIARELVRRVLTPGRARLTEIRKRWAEATAYAATSQDNGQRVARAFGTEIRHPERQTEPTFYADSASIRVSGDRVYFDRLSVTVEQAIAIAAVLKGGAR